MTDAVQLALFSASVFIWSLPPVMSPGPVLVVTVTESTRRGTTTGPLITLGHAFAEVPLIVALVLGLGLLMGHTAVQAGVGLLGGGFLLVMSLDFLFFARKASLAAKSDEDEVRFLRYGPIAAGALASVSSPFFLIWWVGAGSPLALEGLKVAGFLGVLIFIPSHLLADLLWYTGISLAVHRGTRVMSDRVFKAILAGCGLFLLYQSLRFVAEGISALQTLL